MTVVQINEVTEELLNEPIEKHVSESVEEHLKKAREELNNLPPEIDDVEVLEEDLDDRTEQIKKVADASNAVNIDAVKRVKMLMIQHDVSQVKIVKEHGFDKGDVSKVVHFKRRTPVIRAAIAKAMDLTVEELFRD